MSTPELAAVQMQLAASAEQLQITSTALDNLRNKTRAAMMDLRRLLQEEQQRNRGHKDKEDKIYLVRSQSFEGVTFNGTKMMEYKGWAKQVKIFRNSQHRGFRAVLEKAEENFFCRNSIPVFKPIPGFKPLSKNLS